MSRSGGMARALARRVLRAIGLEVRRTPRAAATHFSHLGEQEIIRALLAQLGLASGFCVDIAASDGTTMSNTLPLYEAGWGGVAAECDPAKFAALAAVYARFPRVDLMRCMVTPDNVTALLEVSAAPEEFEFLNLDIDGYDYFVLERILHRYRPRLICVEVNEKIPPPLKFTVRWDPRYVWAGDHFYGASISKMHELCVAHHYALTELHYNSAFLVPAERWNGPSLTPEEAWRAGYLDQPDRREKFPWNADMEALLSLPAPDAVAALRERFRGREEFYELHL